MAAAGVGGYLAMGGGSAVHLAPASTHVTTLAAPATTETPETGTKGPDLGPDVQQRGGAQSNVQSGPQDTSGGPDTAAAGSAPEADAAGG
ncbi:MAG: hypothetical protein ACRENL_13365 [Candidatus Dormibacteria bacterium]